MRHASSLLITLAIGCGGAPQAGPTTDSPPASFSHLADDRCSFLPRECIEGFDLSDEDGCPDPPPPEIIFAPGSSVLSESAARGIDEVSFDGRRLWPGASIRLVAVSPSLAAERYAVVRAALIAAGVPAQRISEGGSLPALEDGRAFDVESVVIAVDHCAM
jgi:hypothetical protein